MAVLRQFAGDTNSSVRAIRGPDLHQSVGGGKPAVPVLVRGRALLRSYLDKPKVHQGPAFEWFDFVYALVVVAALLALAGWQG